MKDWKRYITAFVLTSAIFATAFWASNYFNSRRILEIRALQEGIATDILSLETQFDLFEGHISCANLTENTVFSEQLYDLAARLSAAEKNLGVGNEEVVRLKRSYTLAQIKDYVLMTRITERCGGGPTFILYFYSNQEDACPDCDKQAFVLSAISEEFPRDVRVYAFDYDLNLGALETLIALNKVEASFPALIVNSRKAYGFQDREAIEEVSPALEKLLILREKEQAQEKEQN